MKGESALTDEITDWILCSCPRAHRGGYSGASSTDFLPHTALGPCQIYSYPWRALIGDLESGTLQSHLEYWPCRFYPPLRETARGERLGNHKSRTEKLSEHRHTLLTYPAGIIATPCHIRVWRHRADCRGCWDATLGHQSQLAPLQAAVSNVSDNYSL